MYVLDQLNGVYQTAQKMATIHLSQNCHAVPDDIRAKLISHKDEKSHTGGGISYWSEGLRLLGIYENGREGLAFGSEGDGVKGYEA